MQERSPSLDLDFGYDPGLIDRASRKTGVDLEEKVHDGSNGSGTAAGSAGVGFDQEALMLLTRFILLSCALVAAPVVLASSSTDRSIFVQVLTYPDSPAPSASLDPDTCARLQILKPEDAIPVQCTPFGDVYLGKGGNTASCAPVDLEARLRAQACESGASLVKILRLLDPRGGSKCHTMRAVLFSCIEVLDDDANQASDTSHVDPNGLGMRDNTQRDEAVRSDHQ
ncbi:MAG TPA: hypothetical protein VEC18_00370 [Myxococcota bacterium]|nr:hypothetical protein [Myxococcota bacterium]